MMDDLDNAHVITHLFRDFWTPLIAAVKARRPAVRFVGEQWDWGYGADYLTRGGADSVFAFPLRDALIRLQKQPILDAIAATQAATPLGKRQVVFLENHDTDRFASVVDEDGAKARAGAALLLLLAGDPAIYYGQELGMRGRKGPPEASDAPDIPRREAFRWDADLDADGSATWYRPWDRVWTTRFNRSNDGVSVAEETDDPRSLLTWYRQLIALRRERSEVRHGTQAFPCATASPVLCILRRDGAQQTLLLVNLSDAPASPVLDSAVRIADFQVVIGSGSLAAPLARYDVRVAETP
jgi:glycosidase